MKELPKYRIVKPYRWYSKGFIIQPPAMLRNELLRGGFIELVIDEPAPIPAEASTDIEPEQPPAQVEPPTQKRGRRKRVNREDSVE